MKKCESCKRPLDKDEIALNKKLLGRSIKQYLCLDCLAIYLNTDIVYLEEQIVQFKEDGCALFF